MRPARLGPYRILSELGSGGMGVVYKAEVERPAAGLKVGDRVALKVLHPHLVAAGRFFERFLREAEIGKQVRHANVVRTYAAEVWGGDGEETYHFLVLEYVEGQTLRALLDELRIAPEALCRHIGREVAGALEAIHRVGAIHRDLKPENVLITGDHVIKVMDLGLARLIEESIRFSKAGAFAGSVLYGAPEQFLDRDVDHRADLYALGLLLYEMATGTHPFAADEPGAIIQRHMTETARPAAELNPRLTPFFEEVLERLLAKDPGQRFASAAELLGVFGEGESSAWWHGRVLGIRAERKGPLRRLRIPRETALYGRDDERAQLQARFERVRSGEGQVVLIEGEAGVGKSRLADEFLADVQRGPEELHVLFASYPPGGAATAAGGFSTAYREYFGEECLEEALASYLTVTPSLVPAFAAVLQGTPPPAGREPLTRDSLLTVFVHLTRALARERPTVIVIEDLHLAPEEGRHLFAALALATPGHRILLLGTMRPGVAAQWAASLDRLPHVSRIQLGRLTPKDLGRLLSDAFRSERLAQELGWKIAVKSDCNPLFALEIVGNLRAGGFIAQAPDGSWVKSQVIDRIEIPSSVMDLIQARMADLGDEDKDLLDVAACCGFEFDALLVGEVAGLERTLALKRLARIERRHRLVHSIGRRFAFDHHQVQEALYEALPELLREDYHGMLGEALERHWRKRGTSAARDPAVVDICDHFLRARRPEPSRTYLDLALDHLEAGYLNAAAVELADRALAEDGLLTGDRRVAVIVRKLSRLSLLGRREEERACIDEALTLIDADGDPRTASVVHHLAGMHLLHTSRYDAACAEFEKALALARGAGDVERERNSASALGAACLHLGRHAESRSHHERALALSHRLRDIQGEARATGNLGNVDWTMGEYGRALAHYRRDAELSRGAGDRRAEAQTIENLAVIYKTLGRVEEALGLHERALGLFRAVGDRRGEAIATGNLANLMANLGRTADARKGFERHLDLSREIEYRSGVYQAHVHLGAQLAQEGEVGEARRHLESAQALAAEIRAPEAGVSVALELALLPGGDVVAARDLLEKHARAGDLGLWSEMEFRFKLGQATGERAQIEAAHRILGRLRERVPPEYRDTFVANVALHRKIERVLAEPPEPE